MNSLYRIEKEIQESPCEHPECERFHQRFMQRGVNGDLYHETKTVWWVVVETATGDQAYNASTKSECVRFVKLNERK
jgi:hypothetical protein